jgi:hypothetical protein|nr:MAG TPA_asm: tail protein [Caudoviricetes sp.]
MSVYGISKVSRNKYITDDIKACEQEIKLSHELFLNIKNCIMSQTDENRIEEWEEWFGLSDEKSWSLKDRIDRLIYTFNSRGFFTPKFLKDQAMIFTNGEIDIIEDFPNYHFTIQFTSMIGTPPNLDNFKEMVYVNKPAHLTYDIKYRYRTWGELKPFIWGTLAQYTWAEVRSSAEIKEV